jgi:uncharacterized membrane protein
MNNLYTILIVIHVLSAIVGVGPVFFFNLILKRARNNGELIYAHRLVEKMSRNANVGFGLLLLTGLSMGWINPYYFKMTWYVTSIILFFLSGCYAMFIIEPKLKRLAEIASNANREAITDEYRILFKKKAAYDWFGNLLAIAIILLMILKP